MKAIFIMAGLALLIACTSSKKNGEEQAQSKRIEINQSVSDQPIEIMMNDSLEISLQSNPTTGYEWMALAEDSLVLKQTRKRYIEKKTPMNMVGAGGTTKFTFKPLKTGRSRLTFVYRRPFEKNKSPLKTIQYTIIVKQR